MDVVSDAIAAVRAGRPSSNRLRVTGRWGARMPGYAGAGFHVVLAGSCWLLADGHPPVRLHPGDAVLLPHGTTHTLSSGELTPRQAERLPALDALLALPDGHEGGRADGRAAGHDSGHDTRAGHEEPTELLCGKYRLDHGLGHPLMRELPEIVHLPTRSGAHPELRAAVDLLGTELATDLPGGRLAVPALIDLLLVYLVRAWTRREGADGWCAAL
ncbi:cupin domain-containing protein, partial [Streptomyces sp. FH025]|uniref:cupin domain-containing protein n=1 Tax=Streptomyces sp. FH025 TaxID=2815937 RepID=UPI001A9F4B16